MCGIVGYAVRNKNNNELVIETIRKYASHKSWRIREAVAMGIQEISEENMQATLKNISKMQVGNFYEKRAIVTGLCEPKLLKDIKVANTVISILKEITETFNHNKLADDEESLRKALAYGWSVAIVHAPVIWKKAFEKLLERESKHIKWTIKENLKKNRLIKMDTDWGKKMEKRLTPAST